MFLFLKFIYLFIWREEGEGGRETEREREKIPTRLCTFSSAQCGA